MNHPMQPIIQHLFQVSSLEDVSRQRLESFVAEYPSFGIGHYLLSRKLQAEGADRYIEETQKTNLYFTNPFWLQWLLENSREGKARKEEETAHPVEEEQEAVVEESSAEPAGSEVGPVGPSAEPAIVGSVVEPAKDTMEVVVEEALFAGADAPAEAVAEPVNTASDAQPGSMVALAEEVTAVPEPTAAEALLQSIEKAKSLRESLQKMNNDLNGEEPIKDEEPPFVLDEQIEAVAEAQAPVQGAQTAAEVKPVAEQTFVFEPYHTIDYFASQGIKLTLEENPSDPLGKQLKSFTDWLKVMRRLPQKEREIIPDRAAEQTVQTIAAHSVIGREVVTETMAEVLAKQGMPERARAVYEKLSLLNPDKRAYFATKIEQLNSH